MCTFMHLAIGALNVSFHTYNYNLVYVHSMSASKYRASKLLYIIKIIVKIIVYNQKLLYIIKIIVYNQNYCI